MNRFDAPPEFWTSPEEQMRLLALSVRGLLLGRGNNTHEVTLSANATTTVIDIDGVTAQTIATLVPRTAKAATAIGAGVIYQTSALGKITIHHDSTADTDRTLGLVYNS